MAEGENVASERPRVEAEKGRIRAERARIANERAKAQTESAEDKLHFLDYWRVVKKRKEIIIAILVIVVSCTFVYSNVAKKTYSSSSRIKITQRQRPMDPFSTEPRFMPFDQYEFETHRACLESYPVLEKVVKGEIYTNRSFWRCSRCSQVKRLDDAKAESLGYVCPNCGTTLEPDPELMYPSVTREPFNEKWAKRNNSPRPYSVEAAASLLKSNLRIRPEKGTRLITIRCESHDSKEAQLIANMVAEAYMQWMGQLRDESMDRAFQALRKQIRIYQYGGPGQSGGLKKDQDEMLKLKEQLSLDAQDHLLQIQELSQWTHTRDENRSLIAEHKTEIQKLSVMTDDERVNSIQNHVAIAQLSIQLGNEEARLEALLARYGDKNPEIIGQRKLIAKIKENLSDLAKGYLESKKFEAAKLDAYEWELNEIIWRLEQEIAQSQPLYSEYLFSKASVDMKLAILQLIEQSKIQEKITNAIPTVDIQFVQRAQLPGSPIRPKPIFNVIISVFVGLTLGTGIAYFVEYLDTSMKSVDDIERYLNLSTLALIPQQKQGLLVHESPKSHAAENYRMLWTNIQFARKQEDFKTVMITSGGAGEGKTTTVVNLGIAAAQMGSKVLLVDSDLRRPKIHKLLKYSNKVGLSNVLLKDMDPRDVLIETEVPGLWAMPSGKLPANVIGLLNSQKMRDVLATLGQDFDVLLLDSPPVMGVSDASVMAGVVDRVLLVIDYKKYPKRLANRARRNLENVGGEMLGTVINNLSVQRGDYYYYGYGYGKGYHYYYSARSEEEEEPDEEPVGAAQATEPAEGRSSPDAQNTA